MSVLISLGKNMVNISIIDVKYNGLLKMFLLPYVIVEWQYPKVCDIK